MSEKKDKKTEEKTVKKKKRRGFVSRRNVFLLFGFLAILFVSLVTLVYALYKVGYVDSYIKEQFVTAFDEMGIDFKSKDFRVTVNPLNLELKDATFHNKNTGEKLFRIGDAKLAMTMQDLYALKPERIVDVNSTELEDVEIWVNFDEEGNSNFSGIEILPPKNSIKFEYGSSKLSLKNSVIHFGDITRKISGDANNVRLFLEPQNEGGNYGFDLTSTDSNFIYDEEKIENISIRAEGSFNDKEAEIAKLSIRTPLGNSILSGTVKNWESPKYDLKIRSNVDLTRSSEIFPMGTPIRGFGDFEGTVTGEGEKYKIIGEVKSDSLAAANVRLKALKVDATVDGKNTLYEAHGKAVAELLTFEDFRIEYPKLFGNIRGTGTNFKWLGELQAIAVKSPMGTLTGLFANDAVAEYRDKKLRAKLGNFRAKRFSAEEAEIEALQINNVQITSVNGVTEAILPNVRANKIDVDGATLKGVDVGNAKVKNRNSQTDVDAENVRVETLETKDARLKDLTAKNVIVQNQNGRTNVTARNVQSQKVEMNDANVENVDASGVDVQIVGKETKVYSNNVKVAKIKTNAAILGDLNIAGVRLSIREGFIEGTSDDFDAGNVDLPENGKLEKVRVSKPVFVLEPSGRYRASLDMSLGGGVLGSIKLGAAKASVVADNDQVELNNLTADVMDGKVDGNATIATNENRNSELKADFTNLDLSKLLALQGGRVIPIEGKTTGKADLTFRGTDFRRSSGTLTANIKANAGNEERGIIPLEGQLGVKATNGLFDIDYANLNTQNSSLNATGRFDLNGNDSNLNLAVNSVDAREIERIVRILNVSDDLERQLDSYEAQLAGKFAFEGNVQGNLTNPLVDGRASLSSLILRGRDVGSVASNLNISPDGIEIRQGILQERDGGNIAFNVNIPNTGRDNISVQAKLNNVNAGNILTAVSSSSIPDFLRNLQAQTSGNLNLSGLPNAMQGEANIFAKNGSIKGESFDNLESKMIFDGNLVNVEKFEAKFGKGFFAAKGNYRTDSTEFDFDAEGRDVPITRILAFFPSNESIPEIEGNINVKAKAFGKTSDTSTYSVNFTGVGEGVRINDNSFGKVSFEGKTVNQVLQANLTTKFRGQTQLIDVNVNFADPNLPLKAETRFDETRLAPYIGIFRKSDPNSIEIDGRATGVVYVDGNLSKLDGKGNRTFTTENIKGTAKFNQFDLMFGESPLNASRPVEIVFNMSQATINNAKFSGGGSNVVINGTKAFNDNGINNLAVDGKLNLSFLNAVSQNVFVNGLADVSVRLTGVNKTARLNGTANVEKTSVSTFVSNERVTFERLKGSILFTTNQVQIQQLTGFLGGGKITATGGAALKGLELDRYRLAIRGNDVTARLPKDFITTGNADIEVNGRRRNGKLESLVSGTFYAKRSKYQKDIDLANLVSNRRETSLSQGSTSSTIGVTKLDLRVLGRNALVVENNLADLTASTDLRVTGDIEFPQISGRITANSGTLFFRDDRYELQRGVITFQPNSASIEPIVNLQTETQISGYQIFANLNGSIVNSESLNITVRSNPSLPQADVISLMTTGSLSNTTNGIPTLAQSGINTATEVLADEIINRPISRATDRLFGLNKFSLDPIISGERRNPTARLTVGRQINRNLLVTYSTNLSEDQNQVLALEYRVSNRLSFIAQYEQRSLTNVTRNRNNFKFEIRLRKRF